MAGETTVLLVTDAVVLPATAVLWAIRTFEHTVASGKHLGLATQATDITVKFGTKSSSLEAVISITETPGFHTTEWLLEAAKILRPGGTLIIQEPTWSSQINSAPDLKSDGRNGDAVHTEANLRKNLLLAGFLQLASCEALQHLDSSAISSQEGLKSILSGGGLALQPVMIKATKPEWEIGSSFSIKIAPSIPDADLTRESRVESILDTNRNEMVNFHSADTKTEAEELVDEDALLTEEDLAKPVIPVGYDDDCEVGKSGKKACKNCTCGRAEVEKNGSLTAEQLQNPQSACGNCGLGDAFRCSSCPYRGLAPFKLGEKITLPGALLTADM